LITDLFEKITRSETSDATVPPVVGILAIVASHPPLHGGRAPQVGQLAVDRERLADGLLPRTRARSYSKG